VGKIKFPHLVGGEEGDSVGAAVAHRPSLLCCLLPTTPLCLGTTLYAGKLVVMNADW
jgi:hypothetical protein